MAPLSTTQGFTRQPSIWRALKGMQGTGWLLGAALFLGAPAAIAQTEGRPVNNQPETWIVAQADTQTGEDADLPAETAIAPPPAPSPAPEPFSPTVSGIIDLSADTTAIMSVGQLRPQDLDALPADRSDSPADWLQSVMLPLYVSPDGDHWGWIYQGWLIPQGQAALAIGRDAGFAMVQAYENLYTFPVLEVREDGWFRVQYTAGGSAWAHTSQLALGEVPLVIEGWEDRLQAQDSLYFLAGEKTQPLRSQPELATNMIGLVAADSLIEPLGFEGDWMRVRVTRPAATCEPLVGATTTEGWMRWRGDAGESLVWYQPDGRCPQAG